MTLKAPTLHENHWSLDPEANSDLDEGLLPKLYKDYYDGLNQNILRKKDYVFDNKNKIYPTSNGIEVDRKISNFRIPRSVTRSGRNTDHAQKIQTWKGYVTSINQDEGFFRAKLFDLQGSNTFEYGEFDMIDVDPSDFDLFEEGASFYWTIGHFSINKQVKKQSELRFQRIAPLSMQEYDTIIDNSNDLNENIIWD